MSHKAIDFMIIIIITIQGTHLENRSITFADKLLSIFSSDWYLAAPFREEIRFSFAIEKSALA